MTIFVFDKLIKDKFKMIKNNNILSFDEYKKKCIEKILLISPLYFKGISDKYIKLLMEKNNEIKILFITIGQKFIINDTISIIIYHKISSNDTNKYYILCFGVHRKFRKFGYGKYSLDEFIEWIKLSDKSCKQKIILLKSIETSLNFYKNYGFIQTNLMDNQLFFKYEPDNDLINNKDKILEYLIN